MISEHQAGRGVRMQFHYLNPLFRKTHHVFLDAVLPHGLGDVAHDVDPLGCVQQNTPVHQRITSRIAAGWISNITAKILSISIPGTVVAHSRCNKVLIKNRAIRLQVDNEFGQGLII